MEFARLPDGASTATRARCAAAQVAYSHCTVRLGVSDPPDRLVNWMTVDALIVLKWLGDENSAKWEKRMCALATAYQSRLGNENVAGLMRRAQVIYAFVSDEWWKHPVAAPRKSVAPPPDPPKPPKPKPPPPPPPTTVRKATTSQKKARRKTSR